MTRVKDLQRLVAVAGALVAAAMVTLTACAQGNASDDIPGSEGTSKSTGAGSSLSCTVTTGAGSPDLTRELALQSVGQPVRACLVSQGSDGSSNARPITILAAQTAKPEWLSLAPVDGGPLPTGCETSRSSVLYVVIDGTWHLARQVGCGSNAT